MRPHARRHHRRAAVRRPGQNPGRGPETRGLRRHRIFPLPRAPGRRTHGGHRLAFHAGIPGKERGLRQLAFCTLNEGLGKVLQLRRLRPGGHPEAPLAGNGPLPGLDEAIAPARPLDLKNIIAQALHMGDELHNRNRAATSLFYRAWPPPSSAPCRHSGNRRRDPRLHQRQRPFLPEPVHGRQQGQPGRGPGHREQQRGRGHGPQRHRFRHPAGRDRR